MLQESQFRAKSCNVAWNLLRQNEYLSETSRLSNFT